MKALLRILPFFAVITVLISCGESKDKYATFGKTQAYESWLWDEYVPQKMERYLDLEWNKASIDWLKGEKIKLAVYTQDDNGNEIPATNVNIYINDILCDGNSFYITTEETEVKFALEFKDEASEGEHVFFLKYIQEGMGGEILDDISFEKFGTENKLSADKEVIMNPLKKKVIWGSTIFFALCIVWYIVSRFMIWRSTPFSKVSITYSDGRERTIRMRGGYSLVCTANTKTKDSLLSKIFKGSKTYEYNDFWTYPIELNRGSKRRSISITGRKKYTVDGVMERRMPIEIINENGDKAIIQTT